MKGNFNFVEPVLKSIEYVQSNHANKQYYSCNGKGIVAADHDHVSTGFDWEYNNRLHIGATCWSIFAELGVNPYYIGYKANNVGFEAKYSTSLQIMLYPNPTNGILKLQIENAKGKVMVNLNSITGVCVFREEFDNAKGLVSKEFDFDNLPKGVYLFNVINGESSYNKKLIVE